MATKTEDGRDFPASDYCYVPDPDQPSTWKLRITSTPGGSPDAGIVGAAAAALGPGFRGNQVDIPDSARGAALACVRRAWQKAHPDMDLAEAPQVLHERSEDATGDLNETAFDSELQLRSRAKREVDLKLLPWNVSRVGRKGPEVFLPGAFEGIDPRRVVLQLEHLDPPAGKGIALEERSDGPYMTFKVSNTQRGDEILELAADGITNGASVSYYDLPGGTEIAYEGGRRTRVIRKADLRAVSTTWRPTWEQSAVLNVRSKQQEATMAEPQEAPVNGAEHKPEPAVPAVVPTLDLSPLTTMVAEQFETFGTRMKALEERSRSDFRVPGGAKPKEPKLHEWASIAFKMLKGGRIDPRELHERALDDVITDDNPGLVPDAFVRDLVGIINSRRPFLQSTEQIAAPSTGMSLIVPVIGQHSTAAVQATQKTEIESTALQVTTASFDGVSIFGGADVAIQMLRRADPSFFDLLMRDLAMAYAKVADNEAIDALIAAGPTAGTGSLNPESLTIGEAWTNSLTNFDEPPDTIWLSSAAVPLFINAKSDGTNAPLYFTLNANIQVGNLPTGTISLLRPVYTPSLDHTAVDVLIGPSRGFVWAEDGTFTLQADNPTQGGRDIALGGILFPVPRYPDAFTTYAV